MKSLQFKGVLTATTTIISMMSNFYRSTIANTSPLLLVSLVIQQIGNMLVSLFLISTKLDDTGKPFFIGSSVLAFSLTMFQVFMIIAQKIYESNMLAKLRLRR